MRESGFVKYVSAERGFGFIRRRGAGDLFFHAHQLEPGAEVSMGDTVTFEVFVGHSGRECATAVVVLDQRYTEAHQ